ncbi:MAG TPA: response regulator transcription factor [bacterium]|nr:response regulator transcription factor [bacterium]
MTELPGAQTILIADDEEDFLQILTYNLEKEGFRVIAVNDGKAALAALAEAPDLIILDIMMPERNGYEVCKDARSRGIRTPIIFLTAKDTVFDEVRGFEAGGDDYITKPFSPMTLLARVRAHLRKSPASSDCGLITIGDLVLNPENFHVTLAGIEIEFTRTEFNLLGFLVRHPNIVHTRGVLLSNVWGDETFVVDRTVDVHVGKVRKKLKEYGAFIETKAGVGYRFNTHRIEHADQA